MRKFRLRITLMSFLWASRAIQYARAIVVSIPSLYTAIIPVFLFRIWNNNQVQVQFYLFSDARSHGSLFCLFLPISAEEPSASIGPACGLVPASFMWYRSDVNGEANGCASLFDRWARHFPSLEQNGEKKEGIWQTVYHLYNRVTLQIVVFKCLGCSRIMMVGYNFSISL